jgi:hypothetical protein
MINLYYIRDAFPVPAHVEKPNFTVVRGSIGVYVQISNLWVEARTWGRDVVIGT